MEKETLKLAETLQQFAKQTVNFIDTQQRLDKNIVKDILNIKERF